MHTNQHTHIFQRLLAHTTQWCSDCNHTAERITGNTSVDPTNQELSRSRSSQSNLSFYCGPGAGGVSLGSKSISVSLCVVVFISRSPPFSLYKRRDGWLNNTSVTSHCSYWLCQSLFLQTSALNVGLMKFMWKSVLLFCFSQMLKLISIMIYIQFFFYT